MPDVAELGRRVKAKYPQYANIDDAELGRRIKAKYPQYAAFTDMPTAPPPSSAENVAIGGERGYYSGLEEPATSLMGALGAATHGNFTPLLEMGRSVAGSVYNLGRRRPE